jgi:hypothetical protein
LSPAELDALSLPEVLPPVELPELEPRPFRLPKSSNPLVAGIVFTGRLTMHSTDPAPASEQSAVRACARLLPPIKSAMLAAIKIP